MLPSGDCRRGYGDTWAAGRVCRTCAGLLAGRSGNSGAAAGNLVDPTRGVRLCLGHRLERGHTGPTRHTGRACRIRRSRGVVYVALYGAAGRRIPPGGLGRRPRRYPGHGFSFFPAACAVDRLDVRGSRRLFCGCGAFGILARAQARSGRHGRDIVGDRLCTRRGDQNINRTDDDRAGGVAGITLYPIAPGRRSGINRPS